jgi:hypothetical protein
MPTRFIPELLGHQICLASDLCTTADADVLSELTDGDLEKIGVSLGRRKRLLKAAAALAGGVVPASPATAASDPPAAPVDAAERRQLTVMFSDLVGSTALSARLRRQHKPELGLPNCAQRN